MCLDKVIVYIVVRSFQTVGILAPDIDVYIISAIATFKICTYVDIKTVGKYWLPVLCNI